MKTFEPNERVEVKSESWSFRDWEPAVYGSRPMDCKGWHWVRLGKEGTGARLLIPSRRIRKALVK